MDISRRVLSDIVVHSKYSKYVEEKKRRETYEEIVIRNKEMHKKKFPELSKEIDEVYDNYVMTKKVLPSMRSMQFAGKAIEVNEARIYNCSYLPAKDMRFFSELMLLLLGGSGVGYSVQKHHTIQMPPIEKPNKGRRFVIEDSIAGWADAIKVLMKSYTIRNTRPIFDFSQIRPKGARLITAGGKAPGAAPLKTCLTQIENALEHADGRKLKTVEVHQIACHIADAVLSGGIRRAAMISFFSLDDYDMLTCKSGQWWEDHPEYARANNSVVLKRGDVDYDTFMNLWERVKASGSGEPGFMFTNDFEVLGNPCFTGDTLIAVADGRNAVSIKQLAEEGKYFDVYSGRKKERGEGWKAEIQKAKAFKTGIKGVVTVALSDGSEIRCTPDHRFALPDGSYCEAKDLKGKRLSKFFTSLNKYRTINSYLNGHARQYRMIWEFYNGKLPSGYEIDHIENNRFDGLENLQLLERSEHLCKTSSERLGELNGIHKIKDCEIYRQNKSAGSFMEGNPTYSGLSNEDLINIGRECLSLNGKITKPLLLKINEKFPKSFSKNRFGGKFKNYIDIVSGSAEYKEPLRPEKISRSVEVDKRYSQDVYCKDVINKGEVEDVYDLTVDSNHNFYVITKGDESYLNSSGVLVHNCNEIALSAYGFCNLTEINAASVENEEDFIGRCRAAAFIGTLQASYTDFYYLRDEWKETAEKEALLGVSITGISSMKLRDIDKSKGAVACVEENARVAGILGINPAKRITTIKPAGTTSLVLGSSSGIHAYHAPYYIRRMRIGKNESIYKYLKDKMPELIEDCFFRPHDTAILSMPQKSPEGAIFRNEPALKLLERSKKYYNQWIKNGHNEGVNTHNVSITVSIKDDEWDIVGEWMWANKNHYNGISVLPYDGGTYKQAPFEEITKEQYEEMYKHIQDIDLTKVIEDVDETDLAGELACSGGSCEIT